VTDAEIIRLVQEADLDELISLYAHYTAAENLRHCPWAKFKRYGVK